MTWGTPRILVAAGVAAGLPDLPGRDILVAVIFLLTVASMILQGSTITWVLRRLRLADDPITLAEPQAAADEAAAATQRLHPDTPTPVIAQTQRAALRSRRAANALGDDQLTELESDLDLRLLKSPWP